MIQHILNSVAGETGSSSRAKLNAVIDIINDYALTAVYDTAANFTAANLVLPERWMGIETDTITTNPKYKISDGVTAWNDLPYANIGTRGLIKIIDPLGELFTDLPSAHSYLITYTGYPITDESFVPLITGGGIYYFTVPVGSEFNIIDNFLGYTSCSLIDKYGLIQYFANGAFTNNHGNNVLGNCSFGQMAFNFSTGDNIVGDCSFVDTGFRRATGTNKLGNCVYGNACFILATGTFYVGDITLYSPTDNFAQSACKIICLGNIGPTEGANYPNFGSNTTTFHVKRAKFTSNAGAIHGDLQTAIANGSTVFFDGEGLATAADLSTLETNFNAHALDTANPHEVTLEQARAENASLSGDINANSNTIINLKDAVNPQEPVTKIQFDTYISAVGGQRGDIDCSANPNYPASNKGDRWEVTVAGLIGGALGVTVQVYDEIVCKTTSVAGDQATVGANFYIVQGNLERATETVAGYVQLATDADVQGATENTKAFTSLKLQNWFVNIKTLAHTFAAKITFSTAPRLSSVTAGEYLKVDGSKDLTSVSAIPATDITTDSTHRFTTDAAIANAANQTNTNTGDETATRIAVINHGATSKTTIVDADEITGQDSASSFSLIRISALNFYNYLKSKFDSVYEDEVVVTDYSATSTVNGWAGAGLSVNIKIISHTTYDIVFFDISGTSNAATTNFSIPTASNAAMPVFSAPMWCSDGGTIQTGRMGISAGSNVVTLTRTITGTAFNASGVKLVRGQLVVYK